MNELIISGIIGAAVIAVFAATWVVENIDRIGEWLFDHVTEHHVKKMNERRRKKWRRS